MFLSFMALSTASSSSTRSMKPMRLGSALRLTRSWEGVQGALGLPASEGLPNRALGEAGWEGPASSASVCTPRLQALGSIAGRPCLARAASGLPTHLPASAAWQKRRSMAYTLLSASESAVPSTGTRNREGGVGELHRRWRCIWSGGAATTTAAGDDEVNNTCGGMRRCESPVAMGRHWAMTVGLAGDCDGASVRVGGLLALTRPGRSGPPPRLGTR